MQNENCGLDFTAEDYEELVNFNTTITQPENITLCYPLGTPIDFPIQELVIDNITPTNFVIRGLPSINGGEVTFGNY